MEERDRRLRIGRKIMLESGGVCITRQAFKARWLVLGGWSATVADQVLRELVRRGEVVQVGRVRVSGRGRPAALYRPGSCQSVQK